MLKRRLPRRGLLLALMILIADQLCKWVMLEVVHIQEIGSIEVTSFFNLVMVWNPGISFGMGRGLEYSPLIFSALAVTISLGLCYWLSRTDCRVTAAGIGLIVGGAIGNVIDRVRFGAVADFFDFHIAGFHWPAFNIADASVFIGAVVISLYSSFHDKTANKTSDKPKEKSDAAS